MKSIKQRPGYQGRHTVRAKEIHNGGGTKADRFFEPSEQWPGIKAHRLLEPYKRHMPLSRWIIRAKQTDI